MKYFIKIMLNWFLPELRSFGNFLTVSRLCNSSCSFQWILMKPSNYSLQLLLQFSVDFSETFQLLLPWPEEDHIILRLCLTAFYQSYGPLSVLAIYQQKFLSPQLLVQFSRDFDETFQLLLSLDVSRRDYSNGFLCPSLDPILLPHNSQGILMKLSSYCCPPTLFEGTIGMDLSFSPSINPSVSPSVDKILSM